MLLYCRIFDPLHGYYFFFITHHLLRCLHSQSCGPGKWMMSHQLEPDDMSLIYTALVNWLGSLLNCSAQIFRALRLINNVTRVIYQVPDWISGPVSDSVNVSNHQDQGVIPYGGKGDGPNNERKTTGMQTRLMRRVFSFDLREWRRMPDWDWERERDHRFSVLKGSLSKTRGWAKESREEATRLLIARFYFLHFDLRSSSKAVVCGHCLVTLPQWNTK